MTPSLSLSVVMPVYNEAGHLPATIESLLASLERTSLAAELVLVDDGSTDGSADIVAETVRGRLPFLVVRQPNGGRFVARRVGLKRARADLVLLLDARARLLPEALAFLSRRVERGETIWNGHVHVESSGPLATFWKLLAELAWREYFDDPRTTSFGAEEFDRFPTGTTCFVAPRAILLSAFGAYRSHYANPRLANDDTPLLRELAGRHLIRISPEFACLYAPRTSVARFFRHAVHRGAVFVDGHGRRVSRFFPAVVAFYPVSAIVVLTSMRRPLAAPVALIATSGAAAAYGVHARRTAAEVRVLALVTPLYAAGHALGMWRGLFEIAHRRLAK